MLTAVSRLEADPASASPALARATQALAADYPALQREMGALMTELDNDDLAAIDRAIALSRLGDLRETLRQRISALVAASV